MEGVFCLKGIFFCFKGYGEGVQVAGGVIFLHLRPGWVFRVQLRGKERGERGDL